jgi:hypothetical protein
MGRPRKKPAHELTTEETLRKLFPKRVADKAKDVAEKASKKPSNTQDNS